MTIRKLNEHFPGNRLKTESIRPYNHKQINN